jgi:hypothetical protein
MAWKASWHRERNWSLSHRRLTKGLLPVMEKSVRAFRTNGESFKYRLRWEAQMHGLLGKHAGAFGPDDIRILVDAFDKAWQAVQASGAVFDADANASAAQALLAKHIIEAARQGERDQRRLRDGALIALAKSNLRNPPQRGR